MIEGGRVGRERIDNLEADNAPIIRMDGHVEDAAFMLVGDVVAFRLHRKGLVENRVVSGFDDRIEDGHNGRGVVGNSVSDQPICRGFMPFNSHARTR